MYTVTLTKCVPLFAPVLTAVQILMFSHAILPWVRKVLIDLGLTELRNVRDSAAPRSYVDSQSLGRGSARLEAT